MRQITALFMLFFAFCFCANAEISAINAKKSCVVTDESGNAVFDCSEFDIIFPLKNDEGTITGYAAGIFAQSKSVSYALLSPRGTKLTGYSYTYITPAANGFIACKRDEWYCLNSRGNIVSQGYSDMEYTGSRTAFALTGDPYDEISDDLIMLFSDGSTYETGIKVQYGLGEFSEGLMPLVSGKNLLTGYVDINGAWALEPVYKYAAPFENGRAIVACELGYGVIDRDGNEIIKPEYSFLSSSDEYFCCIKADTAVITDSDGNKLSETPLEGGSAVFSDSLLIVSFPGSVRVLDPFGALLFETEGLCSLVPAGDHIIIQDEDLRYAVSDRHGNLLTDSYDAFIHMEDDVFAFGIMDSSGKPEYGLLSLSDGIFAECMYDSVSLMQPGVYAVESNGFILLIYSGGNTIRVN